MKRLPLGIALAVLLVSSANAALLSRLGGQAYYDSVLDITWLADANYAQTSAYDGDGLMNWASAQSWITSLNSAGHLGASDWRLPTTLQPDISCQTQNVVPGYPNQSSGYFCTGSEMGHLFNVDLISNASPNPFSNVQPGFYWSDTSYAPDTSLAWAFRFNFGSQSANTKTGNAYAWAVRSGDIGTVPVPAAVWLLGSALGVMGVMRRKIRG
ncbi:MAG: VPLPA-CTERM sorting domain-containing protein [Gammaproteobacteria bacterium]|nr:VPLPA-CTERM sorting domain-containing protein [Gammaproteobacteria bacterium]